LAVGALASMFVAEPFLDWYINSFWFF
jgi:hypothetical protein